MHVLTLTAHNTKLNKQIRKWKDEWISQDALIMMIHFLSFFSCMTYTCDEWGFSNTIKKKLIRINQIMQTPKKQFTYMGVNADS